MNDSFELYLLGQAARGRSREEALSRLREAWDRENRERLEAARRVGSVMSRAG